MTGLHFEEFEVGSVIHHILRRTVTEADNVLFCALTMNPQPLHLDAEYAKGEMFGQRLVNSLYTLGLVCGMTVTDHSMGTAVANLGFEEIAFPHPVFHGDTLRVETEVVSARASKSHPAAGIVVLRHVGINQRDEIVCVCQRSAMFKRLPIDNQSE